MTDVMAYIDTAHDSVSFVKPPSTANKSIKYQLFEEIKSVLTVQSYSLYVCVCTNMICTFSDAINYAYLKLNTLAQSLFHFPITRRLYYLI
jgi:hypothetical protein